MLTPAFELSQNASTITIVIKAPFAKISDAEIFIEGSEFKFYSKPYYLRLNLPGEIVENGSESAKYDTDKGSFTVQVPKATPGEHFDGLDMLTRLLAPVGTASAKGALIEVLDSREERSVDEGEALLEEEDIDWQIEQEPYEEATPSLTDTKYGFASQRSGVFKRLQSELHGVIDLPDADVVPAAERYILRTEHEDAHFQDEHYLADLYQDDAIKEVLAYRPHWVEEYNMVHAGTSPEDAVEIDPDMKEKMLKLPRKEYLLDKTAQKEALLGLVDLMFAYAYNHRSTEGENTVESSWVIAKLSTVLSWLEAPTSVKAAVVASSRRCLCYPIYRNWKLIKRLLKDVQRIFITGRRCILRCLLEMHSLLQDTDSRYILNDLYITDYCVWIQSVREKHIKSLAKSLSEVKLNKGDVGFDLLLLEHAAELAVDENNSLKEDTGIDLASRIQGMSLQASPDEQISIEESDPTKEHCSETNMTHTAGSTNGGSSSEDSNTSESEDSESSYESDSSEGSCDSCQSATNASADANSASDKSSLTLKEKDVSTHCPQLQTCSLERTERVLIEDITDQT